MPGGAQLFHIVLRGTAKAFRSSLSNARMLIMEQTRDDGDHSHHADTEKSDTSRNDSNHGGTAITDITKTMLLESHKNNEKIVQIAS